MNELRAVRDDDELADLVEMPWPWPIEDDDVGTADVEVPTSAERANDALRELARITRERDELAALYQRDMDRLQAERDAAVGAQDRRIGELVDALETYLAARIEAGQTKVVLPAGRLTSTRAQPSIDIDEEAFVAWATVHAADLIRTTTTVTPARNVLRQRMANGDGLRLSKAGDNAASVVDTKTGEVIPGVTVSRGGTRGTGRHLNIIPAPALESGR